MKDRIKEVRKMSGLNQTDFGTKIGVSRDVIANIEYGRVIPKDIHILAICQNFKVNEEWLRTGSGEMLADTSEDAQLFEWIGSVLAAGTTEPDFQVRTLNLLRQLKPEHWKALEEIAEMIYESEKEHRG